MNKPREYPAVHPEKPSRALLLIAIALTVAWMAVMIYTNKPGLDTPANSPDIMQEDRDGRP